MSGTVTRDTWEQVAAYALGTCDGPTALAERFDLEVDTEEVEERLLDANVETCPGCGWWVDSGELADDDTCSDCRS